MRVISDRQLSPWLIVSDAMFNAAKASRFIAAKEERQPEWISEEPRMPRIAVRYPPYGWQLFLVAGLDGVIDLSSADGGRRTGKTLVEERGYDLDAWLQHARIERAAALTARGIIRHDWKARVDRLGTNTLQFGTADINRARPGLLGWSEHQLDFFDEFQGGDLTVVALIQLPASFAPGFPLLVGKVTRRIRGRNPSKPGVRAYVDATLASADDGLAVKVIAWKESKFLQFIDRRGASRGMPTVSRDGTAFGIMQLKNLGENAGRIMRPRPREIWNWQANVDGGVRLYKEKKKTIHRYYGRILATNSAAARRFKEQFKQPYRDFYRYAYYQLYYGGYYWRWNGSNWARSGTSNYGRELARVEDGIRMSPPVYPPGWD